MFTIRMYFICYKAIFKVFLIIMWFRKVIFSTILIRIKLNKCLGIFL